MKERFNSLRQALAAVLASQWRAPKLALQWRLRHLILACVLVSILVTEFIVLGGSYIIWSRDQYKKLDEETLLMLKANVEATSFPSIDDILKMGGRITSFSTVRGGTIYNRLGERMAAFGAPPSLTMLTFQRENIRHYISSETNELEVFYPTDMTGFANPLVLRIDAAAIPAILKSQLQEKAVVTLVIGFVSSIAIVFLLSLFVVRPVLKLRNAVSAATDNPNLADKAKLNWPRKDEFGDVAKALDQLFTTVSVVYQEDLAAGQEAMQRAAFAVLNYNAHGELISVNNAAHKLFGIGSHQELAGDAGAFIRKVSDEAERNVSPLSLMSEHEFVRTVNVATKSGVKRCIMNGITVHNRSGAVLRTIITLIDITAHVSKTEELKKQIKALEEKDINSIRRMTEMRTLFQSCMILLTHASMPPSRPDDEAEGDKPELVEDVAKTRPVTLTDRIVNAWYYESSRAHLIHSKFSHEVLPPAYGTSEEIEAIFRQAFMYVYSQARIEKPSIRIEAEKLTDTHTLYKIWEEENETGKARALDEALLAGSKLTIASLRHSLKALNGDLKHVEPHAVHFSLRTASFSQAHFSQNSMNVSDNPAEIQNVS